MRVLLFGAKGLLGRALASALVDWPVTALDRETLDVTDPAAVERCFADEQPEVVINTAAYNAVDAAERDPAAAREAFAVNGYAVHRLAAGAAARGATFVHFSTDYVFDGEAGRPYREDDQPRPVSVYGRSKLEGEETVLRLSDRDCPYYLIRTSRLFGSSDDERSKRSFVDVVLGQAAAGGPLAFIDGEEVASPTYAPDLALAVRDILTTRPPAGIYHRTNDGAASWYEFARAILEESGAYATTPDVPGKTFVELRAVGASAVPRPARRPRYSVLQSTKLPKLRGWRDALRDCFQSRPPMTL